MSRLDEYGLASLVYIPILENKIAPAIEEMKSDGHYLAIAIREIRKLRQDADDQIGFSDAKERYSSLKKESEAVHKLASFLESMAKNSLLKLVEAGEKISGVYMKPHFFWSIDNPDDVPDEFYCKCKECGGSGKIIDKKAIDEVVAVLQDRTSIPGIVTGKTNVLVVKNS